MRSAVYGTAFVLIACILVFWSTTRGSSTLPGFRAPSASDDDPSVPHGWRFDYRRDKHDYALTQQQCNLAFPDLYLEIDRAVQHRKSNWGMITLDELDIDWKIDSMVRAMIYDNQLYVVDVRNVSGHDTRPRSLSTLHSIHRAISASTSPLPNIEFPFTVDDWAYRNPPDFNKTVWTYTRMASQEKLWLMPDFGLWGWPGVGLRSYAELRQILDEEEEPFADKVPKIVWRGSTGVGSKDVRQGLLDHSRGQSWSDVQVLDWEDPQSVEQLKLTMQDHCSYMYLAQTEGNSYSGRFKNLMNCHSVVVSHRLDWIEHFHHLLQPEGKDQNFIQANRDFSDLPIIMEELMEPSAFTRSQEIADNARKVFRERYLTPAAEACYWRALIRAWAELQSFEPQFWEQVYEFHKPTQQERQTQKPRGVPFEAWAIEERL